MIDPGLIPYGTDRQQEVLAAVVKTNNISQASVELGISRQAVQDAIKRVKQRAEKRLYSPEHGLDHPVPENFTGDFTIQRNADGEVERSWMKGKTDNTKKQEMYEQFIAGLTSMIKPAKPVKKPKRLTDNLASAIVFGDAHIGMIATALETMVEDFDLDVATADIRSAIDYCVDCAPPSEEGWFINVGDWAHTNDTTNMTSSGNILDAVRHTSTMEVAGQLVRYCIDKMLTKFGKVIAINARGNHDRDAAFGMNLMLQAVYENEPRVEVLGNHSKFNFIEFGNCLIGVNHGDQINANRLAGVMTKQQAPAWGRTTFRRWITGHIHHKQKFEHDSGVTIESFHTLAPVDEWHAASGYGAERRVSMITYHREFGEVNRMEPSIEMLRFLQQA